MTYVIALPCVDMKDRACVEECPVDCIYEGGRSLYIHPDECVDCGACEPVCPVEAIYYEDDLPEKWAVHTADNARFFTEILPGRDTPLGSPGRRGQARRATGRHPAGGRPAGRTRWKASDRCVIVANRCSTRFTAPRNPWACPRSPTTSVSIPTRPASISRRWWATA